MAERFELQDRITWRHVGEPGHDACELLKGESTWVLRGRADFESCGALVDLQYQVTCNAQWVTLGGRVDGSWGGRAVRIDVARSSTGSWTLSGSVVQGLERCTDLDLGFTPATNVLAIRRLGLQQGENGRATAAWLDLPSENLSVLDQIYERRSPATFWYSAPRFDYESLLVIAPSGLVRTYPGLWEEQG